MEIFSEARFLIHTYFLSAFDSCLRKYVPLGISYTSRNLNSDGGGGNKIGPVGLGNRALLAGFFDVHALGVQQLSTSSAFT